MVLSRAPYTLRHADSDEMILLYIHTNLEEQVSRQKFITLYCNNLSLIYIETNREKWEF